jgi:agmatinase
MRPHHRSFLNPPAGLADLDSAAAVLLPVPYEGGVSWGRGAALGPEAVLEASAELEVYDEALRFETCRMGIATVEPPQDLSTPEAMIASVRRSTAEILEAGKFPAVLGGDHSVSVGVFRELAAREGRLSVIQLDAHADLRESYQGARLSHACTMARIREQAPDTLQIGVRSLCREEAERIVREEIPVCTMEAYRSGSFDLGPAVRDLPDPVYLTLDVDALDWSVVRSTGTPEPGGFFWHEMLDLLGMIFREREVVGFDVVELSQDVPDRSSAFAVAKLIYRMLGFKLASQVDRGRIVWPESPAGPVLDRTGAAKGEGG